MSQPRKPFKKIAVAFIVIGILLAAVGIFAGAKFSIISTEDGLKAVGKGDRQNEEFSLPEFKNIEVELSDADIEVIPSNEFKLEIEGLKGTRITHEIENETLIMNAEKDTTWFNFAMNFSLNMQSIIKIYVPEGTELLDVSVSNKFGDTQLAGITSNKLIVKATDGDVSTNNIQTNELAIENKYGDFTGTDVKTNDLILEMNDGNAELESVETENTNLKNKFGNTTLHDFTSRRAKVESTDGNVKVYGELLGQTNIKSSFGNVYLDLENKEAELGYNIQTKFGNVSVNGNQFKSDATHSADTNHQLDVSSTDGDVDVTFN